MSGGRRDKMASKKRGRPLINNVPINRQLFDAARECKGISIAELSKLPEIGVDEKTIRRIRKSQKTNSKMLNLIAKHLNVDPYWLTGQTLTILPSLEHDTKYMNPVNHPYDVIKEQRKFIDIAELLHDILILHGVSEDQYNLLSEEQQNGLQMELDLVTQIVIFSYFSPVAKDDDPFLSNKELYQLSIAVLNTNAYKKLFELLMI